MQLKDQESMNIIHREVSMSQDEGHRCLINIKDKYEEQINQLKKQVEHFDSVLLEKEK